MSLCKYYNSTITSCFYSTTKKLLVTAPLVVLFVVGTGCSSRVVPDSYLVKTLDVWSDVEGSVDEDGRCADVIDEGLC